MCETIVRNHSAKPYQISLFTVITVQWATTVDCVLVEGLPGLQTSLLCCRGVLCDVLSVHIENTLSDRVLVPRPSRLARPLPARVLPSARPPPRPRRLTAGPAANQAKPTPAHGPVIVPPRACIAPSAT